MPTKKAQPAEAGSVCGAGATANRAPSVLDLLPEELLHEIFKQAGLHLSAGAPAQPGVRTAQTEVATL